MFSKKTKSASVNLTSGWTSELIHAVCRNPVEHVRGFRSKDFSIFIDAVVFNLNNFEVERKAYGLLELRVGDNYTKVTIPVVASFIVGVKELALFNDRLGHPTIAAISGLGRIYGTAVLNERLSPEENIPDFEWNFYLSKDEWENIVEGFRLTGKSNFLRLAVRIGLPNSITEESVINDSMNSRLLIHRLWLTSTDVISTQNLRDNKVFEFDMDM